MTLSGELGGLTGELGRTDRASSMIRVILS